MTDMNPSTSGPAQGPVSQPTPPPTAGESWPGSADTRGPAGRYWHRSRGRGGWVGGAILILLGLVFLLQNLHIFYLHNWWALFILIPALAFFAAAWGQHAYTGRFDRRARMAVLWGLALTGLSIAFLLDIQWGLFWPVALIALGVLMLINALLP
jgi:hypothetical protein